MFTSLAQRAAGNNMSGTISLMSCLELTPNFVSLPAIPGTRFANAVTVSTGKLADSPILAQLLSNVLTISETLSTEYGDSTLSDLAILDMSGTTKLELLSLYNAENSLSPCNISSNALALVSLSFTIPSVFNGSYLY